MLRASNLVSVIILFDNEALSIGQLKLCWW